MGRWLLFGGVLAVASANGFGLSLEQSQGRVVLGQPLDVLIPVMASAQDAGSGLCAVVTVAFGESPVAPHQVRWSRQLDSTDAQSQRIRIQTAVVVTEPYVSLEVKAGCTGSQTRVYTLLADMPAVQSTVSVVPPAVTALRGTALVASDPKPKPPGAASTAPSLERSSSPQISGVQPVPDRPKPQPLKSARITASAGPTAPVLKLEPLDLMEAVSSWIPQLSMTLDLPVVDSASTPELEKTRADARRLWATLSHPEESSAAMASQLGSLTAQLAAAKADLQTSVQAQGVQSQLLQDERDARYRNPVFLALVVGLLGCAAGLAVALTQRRRGESGVGEWWKSARLADQPLRDLVKRRKAAKAKAESQAPRGGVASTLDVDLDTLFPPDAFQSSQSSGPSDSRSPITRPGHSEFLPSVLPSTSTSVLTEELFDLQQQVEFFISLGQSEQAVEVLLAHLSDGHEPSPLAYLDLLKLYHQMGQSAKYESLRIEFNAQFNASAPSFDNFSHSRRGLERYPKALTHIQNLWPSPAVLQLIEASLFRQLDVSDDDMFDLEAYRELLLLYGVAREITADVDGALVGHGSAAQTLTAFTLGADHSPQTDFGATDLQPLAAQLQATGAQPPVYGANTEDVLTGQAAAEALFAHGDDVPHYTELDLDLSSEFTVVHPLEQQGAVPTPSPPAGTKSAPAAEDSHALDFDFTDLDDAPPLAIKKSGPAS